MDEVNSIIGMSKEHKLIRAGFRLFRLDFENVRIKIASRPGAWATFEKFPSKAAMIRRWAELMKEEKNIEG